jgi:hypothetical protein
MKSCRIRGSAHRAAPEGTCHQRVWAGPGSRTDVQSLAESGLIPRGSSQCVKTSNVLPFKPDNRASNQGGSSMRIRHRLTSAWAGILTAATLCGATARAELPAEKLFFLPNLQSDLRPTVERPMALGLRGQLKAPAPTWTDSGLWATRPEKLWGLSTVAAAGQPVWDPSTNAWYAWAMGMLVEVRPDGSLPVVLDSLPGHDFDLRVAARRVVYRDPEKDEIVLVDLDTGARKRLMQGWQFFNPRLSPDGSKVLVAESRAGGGHTWLVPVDGAPKDLGQSYHASWHPDGKQIAFVRLVHDGRVISASTLFLMDVHTRFERQLAVTRAQPLTRPAISPDGASLAFVDGRTNEIYVAPMPRSEVR